MSVYHPETFVPLSMQRIRSSVIAVALAVPAAMAAQTPTQAPATPPAGAVRPQAPQLPPNTWGIDKTHSELSFRIRHFMSRVSGTFRDWRGTIALPLADSAKWENAVIDVSIQTASIFTDNERRDADLRSSNFFAADSFPTITFKSTKITRAGSRAKIEGLLTMRGVTKPVVLDGEYLGMRHFPNNMHRVGFAATTTINRLDYGITWNRVVEGGGVTLGDDVTIDIAIEASIRGDAQTTR